MRHLTSCVLVFFLGTWSVWAQPPVPLRQVLRLDDGLGPPAEQPSAALGGGGEAVVVWWESRFGTGEPPQIRARRVSAEGVLAPETLRVDTPEAMADTVTRPDVAKAPGGDFLVVWESSGSTGDDTSSFSIQGRAFDASGAPQGGQFQVHTLIDGYQSVPAVAPSPDGGFLAVWMSEESAGGDDDSFSIQGRRFTASGVPVEPVEFQVNETPAGLQSEPDVAAGADGFFVAWKKDFESVFGRPLDRDGRPAGGEVEIAPVVPGALLGRPAVAVGTAGDVLVVWVLFENGGNGPKNVMGRLLAPDGSPTGEPFPVSSSPPGNPGGVAVTATPSGDFLVVWPEERGGTPRSDDFRISPRGLRILGEGAVTVAAGPEHAALAVWARETLPGDDGQIRGRFFVVPPRVVGLRGGRFRVEVEWLDFDGERGEGVAAVVPGEAPGPGPAELSSRDSGVLELFDPDIWEIVVKVLDGRDLNDHHWFFAAAATDVDYELVVTDTVCLDQRIYANALGRPAAAVTDILAFPDCDNPAPPFCLTADDQLCLGEGGRFRVEIFWSDVRGNGGKGRRVRLPRPGVARSDDSVLFTFFGPRNWELLVKVLDGCGLNGHFWVYGAASTDVAYRLTVTDTWNGEVEVYTNPLGVASPAITDPRAFATCDAMLP